MYINRNREIPIRNAWFYRVPSERNPCNYCGENIYSVAGAKSCLQVKKPFPQAPCPFSKKAGRYQYVIKSLIASTSAKCGHLNSGCTHLTCFLFPPRKMYHILDFFISKICQTYITGNPLVHFKVQSLIFNCLEIKLGVI